MAEPSPALRWRPRRCVPADALISPARIFPPAAVSALGTMLLLTLIFPPPPLLLWNSSASSPVGLYSIDPATRIRAGDMAIARLPASIHRLASKRHYLPAGVPLVKRVAATAGASVCAAGAIIKIDGRPVAVRLARDRAGRRLPWWTGCRLLGPGDLFLLTPDRADAFDGRYFGVSAAREVVGKARLRWRP